MLLQRVGRLVSTEDAIALEAEPRREHLAPLLRQLALGGRVELRVRNGHLLQRFAL